MDDGWWSSTWQRSVRPLRPYIRPSLCVCVCVYGWDWWVVVGGWMAVGCVCADVVVVVYGYALSHHSMGALAASAAQMHTNVVIVIGIVVAASNGCDAWGMTRRGFRADYVHTHQRAFAHTHTHTCLICKCTGINKPPPHRRERRLASSQHHGSSPRRAMSQTTTRRNAQCECWGWGWDGRGVWCCAAAID